MGLHMDLVTFLGEENHHSGYTSIPDQADLPDVEVKR